MFLPLEYLKHGHAIFNLCIPVQTSLVAYCHYVFSGAMAFLLMQFPFHQNMLCLPLLQFWADLIILLWSVAEIFNTEPSQAIIIIIVGLLPWSFIHFLAQIKKCPAAPPNGRSWINQEVVKKLIKYCDHMQDNDLPFSQCIHLESIQDWLDYFQLQVR